MIDHQLPLYGLMAEFDDAQALAAAIRKARAEGYRKLDGYTPFPVHEVAEALDFRRTWIPEMVLTGGIVGLISGFGMQYYASVISYPLNVGGRPFNSWVSFIPVTFEVTILFATLTAVLGMLALNGLPMPYHPVFNVPRFAQATRDRFFMVIEASDPKFNYDATRTFMQTLGAREVSDVPQ
jgi:hypothetical protein